jgi:predicted membrane channel-forming protein YqfA (hemolysin III family)
MTGPHEPRNTRLTRNLSELLQELRVAQAGVQILFAFLLAVVFTDRFANAGTFTHALHLITVLLATTSAALLIAPAAWHRVLFRKRRREDIIRVANHCAIFGLALLATAMTGTVLLIAQVIVGFTWGTVISAGVAALFGFLWFIFPLQIRSR